MMEKFVSGIGAALLVIVGVFIIAVFSGTIIFFLWPHVIPYVFPGIVKSGHIAEKITWFQSVGLTYIFGILIKASQTNKNKKD